ncbi:MAG: YqhA family protein [Rhodomicrobium sp.]
MNRIERVIQTAILQSRWLAAPFLLGLTIGLAALLYTFAIKLTAFLVLVKTGTEEEVIVGVLKLVDLSLTANLLLIVIFSGYENFVGRIDVDANADWPAGLIGIGFSGLKQKLLGSILAIAAVNVLEWFLDIDRSADNAKLAWVVGILLAFAVAMLLLAIADRLGGAHQRESNRGQGGGRSGAAP